MRNISQLGGAYAAVMLLIWAGPASALCPPRGLPDTSLLAYVTAWEAAIPKAGSNGFIKPSQSEMDSFALALEQLFAGSVNQACTSFSQLNYDLLTLADSTSGRNYLIARERSAGLRGRGMYVVDLQYARNLVVEVPHPLYDLHTPSEGVQVLTQLGARAIFVAGTHRCADDEESRCTGTTTACGDNAPQRISDAAHFTQSFFQSAHAVTLRLGPVATVIQLHGQTTEPVDIELSDGTKSSQSAEATVNVLRDAIAQEGVSVASCNWPEDDPESLNRCGEHNTQGRLSNGSGSVCRRDASTGTGRFFHLEQKRNIRDDPSVLITVLSQVFPPDAP